MATATLISDPADPRIAAFRDVRDRDLAGRFNGFIAEGEVVLRALVRSDRQKAKALLIAKDRLEKLSPLIGAFGEAVAIYVAEQTVMDAIVGFHIHRGVLAYGERAPPLEPDALLGACPEGAIVLALVGIANHDNLGGLFRNAAAFGAAGVLLDPTSCDPLYRKSIRVSVGAALTLPFARWSATVDPILLLQGHGFTPLALSPAGTGLLARAARPAKTAVLLGAEGPGLPDDLLTRATTLAIPMAGAFDSLNVAATSAIVLHHLAFAAADAGDGRGCG